MPPKFQRKAPAGPAGVAVGIAEVAALGGVSPDLPRLFEAEIDAIAVDPDQPRTVFDEAALQALAESIARHGLQQPVLVRETETKGRYGLVAGERRLRAHQILGRRTIPAIITTGKPEEIALIENVQRVDLDAVDLARGLQRLIDRHDYAQADVGALIGCTEAEVSRRLSVLRLSDDVLAEYRERAQDISRSVLIEIATLDDPARQRALWDQAKGGLTVRALRSAKKAEPEAASRRRPMSLKAVGLSLDRIAEEVERMHAIRSALQDEHRERLKALRTRIDAVLGQ